MCELTTDEIQRIESARYTTFAEAELHANDLANDDCDGEVVKIGNDFAVNVITN